MEERGAYCIIALYHFLTSKQSNEAVEVLRDEIVNFLNVREACGCLLLATEGINGTICLPDEHSADTKAFFLKKYPDLRLRVSFHPTENVFYRLKVKIKPEIVTMGVPTDLSDPSRQVGSYVESKEEWDKLLKDPECLVIDTRNVYECQVGTFHRAVNPMTDSFVEFPEWLKDQMITQGWIESSDHKKYPKFDSSSEKPRWNKVAMFCTGGIRCEKATSYCVKLLNDAKKEKGNENIVMPSIYHLKGGILSYLAEAPSENSLFKGECYVFDRRTSVAHGLTPSSLYTTCHACRQPLDAKDRQHPDFTLGVSCHACVKARSDEKGRYEERQRQMELCGEEHLRKKRTNKIITTGNKY